MPREAELRLSGSVAPAIDVVVGILRDADDKVLIGRRPEGKHMAGAWEFPGGKREPGETPLAALRRELAEETGIRVTDAEPLLEHRFSYPDRVVRLDVWWVVSWQGPVGPREGQQLRWVAAGELSSQAMLPADEPLVAAVRKRLRAVS